MGFIPDSSNTNSNNTSNFLSTLYDVNISSAANNQLLEYNFTTQKWENKTFSFTSSLSSLTDC